MKNTKNLKLTSAAKSRSTRKSKKVAPATVATVAVVAPAPAPVAVATVPTSAQLCRPGSSVGKLYAILTSGAQESYNADVDLYPNIGSTSPAQIINDLRRILRKHGEGDIVLTGKGCYAFKAPTK